MVNKPQILVELPVACLFNLPYFSELEMPAKSSRSDGFIEGNPPSYHRVVEEGGANGVTRAESTMPRGIPYLKSPSGLIDFAVVFNNDCYKKEPNTPTDT